MNKRTFNWLRAHTGKTHIQLLTASVLKIFTSGFAVLFALEMRNVIDSAVAKDLSQFKADSIMILAVTLLMYVSHVIALYIQENIAVDTMNDLRADMMSAIMRKEYPEIQSKHSGNWMNLLFSDIRIISEGVSTIIPNISGMISRLIMSFCALMFLAPVLACIYLAAAVIVLTGVSLFRGRMKYLHKDVQKKEDLLHALLQEIIENVLVIKAFGAEKHFDKRISQAQSDYSVSRLKRRKYRLISVNLFSLAFRMGYLVALIYGGFQLINGTVTYGTISAILHIISQMQTPILNLSGLFPRIYETAASTERIMETETTVNEDTPSEIQNFKLAQLQDVSFSYGREEVLKNVSFDVFSGETVALTGLSGGGKSTLFLLLLGMYQPEEGTIRIHTENGILQPGTKSRHIFAYVPQGNSLFTGTIKENVVFNHEYDEDRMIDALKTADAYDFIMSLPLRTETVIKERGAGLSEGQTQRLAIARAIYSNAQVLLLDESTSALDEETEARVLRNIKEMKDKTVLIVTHRPAALKICERHLVVDHCHVSEVDV